MEYLQNLSMDVWAWLQVNVFVTEVLIQIGVLALITLLAKFSSKLANKKITALTRKNSFLKKIEDFIDPLYFPVVLLIFVLAAETVGPIFKMDIEVLEMVAYLAAVWIVSRFFTRFIRNQPLAKGVTIIILVMASLNYFDLLDQVATSLKGQSFDFGEITVTAYNIIWGLLTLFFFIWVAVAVSRIIEAQLKTMRSVTPSARVLLVKVSKIFLVILAFLIGLNTMGINLTALAVFGGALGVGIGFGLQKIVSNFISGLVLLMDKSIKPGDVIEIQDTFGSINKLASRYTSVITRDGTEYLIPNEDMVTQVVINWSHTNRVVRRKIPVTVDYKTDLYRARELMNEAAKSHDRSLENPQPITHVKGFGENGVNLELRFWINDPEAGVTNVSSEVMLKIWDNFREEGIEFPFPQRTIHFADDKPAKKRKLKKNK